MKKWFAVVLTAFFTFTLFAEAESTVEKFKSRAEVSCIEGDLNSAYKFINLALAVGREDSDRETVIPLAQEIYKQKLEEQLTEFDSYTFTEILENVEKYGIGNSAISNIKQQITAKYKNNGFEEFKIETQDTFYKLFILIFIIITLMFLIIILIIFMGNKAFKVQKNQTEKYVQAVKRLAQNQDRVNSILAGGVTSLYASGIDSEAPWTKKALSYMENTPEEQDELKLLAENCREMGLKIDSVTNRKNNSSNVGELVYKTSIQLGLPQSDAMLYFCAAMVYDAGFLTVDNSLLTLDSLTVEQRKVLNRHTELPENFFDFVPEKYREVFMNAACCHHENMDGSGYPKGLKGDEIPLIAKLIRVCESYISLSSRRDYRQIVDKETAVTMMRQDSRIYDPDVIDVLEEII